MPDWPGYLARLGGQYSGYAALIVHDYHLRAGEIFERSNNIREELVLIYKSLAGNHPWAPYMWRDPEGTTIFADERKVYPRVRNDENTEEFVQALLEHNIAIGMGAILWKDKHPEPRYVVAIAILRPGDPSRGDAFTNDDKELFACQIPGLVREIKNHDLVRIFRGKEEE